MEYTCKNCGNHFQGKFCNICGEKQYAEHEKSVKHFLQDALHFITHLDSKYFKTLKVIFRRPGLLSLTYCEGNRNRYFKPFALFFIGVILYLVFPFLPGLNMSFDRNLINFRAQKMDFMLDFAEHKAAAKNLTLQELGSLYDQKSSQFAKILLLIILPFTGLALNLLFPRKKKYFFDHLILATEASSITLYLIFFILPACIFILSGLLKLLGFASAAITTDIVTMTFIAVFLITWSIIAFSRFYNAGLIQALIKGVVFLILHYFIIYFIYKLFLFLIILIFI